MRKPTSPLASGGTQDKTTISYPGFFLIRCERRHSLEGGSRLRCSLHANLECRLRKPIQQLPGFTHKRIERKKFVRTTRHRSTALLRMISSESFRRVRATPALIPFAISLSKQDTEPRFYRDPSVAHFMDELKHTWDAAKSPRPSNRQSAQPQEKQLL